MTMPVNDLVGGETLEQKWYFTQGLQIGLFVLHWKVDSVVNTTGAPTDFDIADIMGSTLATAMAAPLCSNATFEGNTVQVILPVRRPYTWSLSGSGAGAISGDPLPKQDAGLIAKLTTLTGRANRGRLYFPFPSEASNDTPGQPGVAYRAALDALGAVLFVPQTVVGVKGTVSFSPIIYHRASGGGQPVVNWAVRTRWATQRRRGDFGAINRLPWINN
jgi:hypothetical protein